MTQTGPILCFAMLNVVLPSRYQSFQVNEPIQNTAIHFKARPDCMATEYAMPSVVGVAMYMKVKGRSEGMTAVREPSRPI